VNKLPSVFEDHRRAIDGELRDILAEYSLPLYDMLRYHLGWIDEHGKDAAEPAGKALRPTLCLLACEAVGGDYRTALPAAAALELIHNFSLIHDDIQDGDEQRRHRPTVWAVWGQAQAINAGTAMRILVNSALKRLERHGVSAEKRLRIQELLDEASLRLIEGQYLDIDYEKRLDITVADYLRMVEGKTGALIACSVETGAALGTDDSEIIEGYRQLGLAIGLSFQIRDDILGIWGDQDVLGKPLASDIVRRKKTLPIVHALESARDGYRAQLEAYYSNGHAGGDVQEILDILNRVGARDYALTMDGGYTRKARTVLAELPATDAARRQFQELISFLEERGF
jgi:geranylgeranyl diphosphate synthase type I